MEWFLDCGSMGSRQASDLEASSPVLRAADSVELEFDERQSNRSSKRMLFAEAADSPPQQEKEDFLDLLLVKHYPDRVAVFDASKKIRRRKSDKQARNDYCKNICGYITRRICREFLSDCYRPEVEQLCLRNSCPYAEAHSYYLGKIELVTGPRHVSQLFTPETCGQQPIKRTFRSFFRWFLKERYVRYLIGEGKMTDKRAYIDYKNRVIASFLQSKEDDEPASSKERDQQETLY